MKPVIDQDFMNLEATIRNKLQEAMVQKEEEEQKKY
jgi:hypothetical protein